MPALTLSAGIVASDRCGMVLTLISDWEPERLPTSGSTLGMGVIYRADPAAGGHVSSFGTGILSVVPNDYDDVPLPWDHEWNPQLVGVGLNRQLPYCRDCSFGSPYRTDPARHLYVIQEW